MEKIATTLNNYGILGVELLKGSIQQLSATGKTVQSIRYEVESTEDTDTLRIFAREYFSTLETGRGPRKSSQAGGFLENMLEYMAARGIGADLDEKKRRNLARFLVLKINREGDRTYKAGGRKLWSDDLDKYIQALTDALVKDFRVTFRNNLTSALRGSSNT